MNSLNDLNVYGSTTLTYTDDRNAAVIFDRTVPLDFSIDTGAGVSHDLPLGIDILEIIKPDIVNTFFEVDVSSVTGATVTWDTLPSGVVYSNPSTGVYRISNIDTKAQWDAVKAPSINILSSTPDYSYNAAIYYEPSKDKTWGISVRISVMSDLFVTTSISAAPTFFAQNYSHLYTTASINFVGGKKKELNFDGTSSFSLYCLAQDLEKTMAILQTAFTMNAQPYDFTKAQVALNAIVQQYAAPVATRRITQNLPIVADVYNLLGIIKRYQSNLNVVATTSPTIAQYPVYQQTITQTGIGADVSMSSDSKYVAARSSDTVYVYYKDSSWTQQAAISFASAKSIKLSKDGTRLVIGGGVAPGKAEIYVRSGSTWTLEQTITPGALDSGADYGCSVSINSDGTYVAVGAQYHFIDNVYSDSGSAFIWTRSGSSWSQQAAFYAQSTGVVTRFGKNIALSDDGALLFGKALVDGNGTFFIFTRSGSTWTQGQGFTAGIVSYSSFADSIDISLDKVYAVVSYPGNSRAFVYKNTSGTWTKETEIILSSSNTQDVSINSDGTRILVTYLNTSGQSFMYARSGSTWTLNRTLGVNNIPTTSGFGSSIAMSADTLNVVVGDPTANKLYLMHYIQKQVLSPALNSVTSISGQLTGTLGLNSSLNSLASISASGADTAFKMTYGTGTEYRPDNLTTDALYGYAASISQDGTRMIVSAVGQDNDSDQYVAHPNGRVYTLQQSGGTWTFGAEVYDSAVTSTGLRFGESIHMSSDGSRYAVGMPNKQVSAATNAGVVKVYDFSSSLRATLQLSVPDTNGYMGYSVAMNSDGTYIAVRGAEKVTVFYVPTSSPYTPVEQTSFSGSDFAITQGRNQSVALNAAGDIMYVGCPAVNSSKGEIRIYTRSGSVWSYSSSFTASDATAGSNFGHSLVLSDLGYHLIIGSGSSNTKVYAFVKGASWTQQSSFTYSTASGNMNLDVDKNGRGFVVRTGTTARTYVRTASSWALSQSFTTRSGAVALDGIGKYMLLSNSAGYGSDGTAYVYTNTYTNL